MQKDRVPPWLYGILPILLGGSYYTLTYISSHFEAEQFSWLVVASQALKVLVLLFLAQAILRWQKQRSAARVIRWQTFVLVWFVLVLVHLGLYIALKSYLIYAGPQNDSIGFWHLSLTLSEGIIFALVITGLLFLLEYWHGWQHEQVRAARLAQEHAQSQFAALKWQLHPHLMFNNLNTLYGLIEEDPGKARQFLLEFSHLFRGILTQAEEDLIGLEDELRLVRHFNFLLSQRYGAAYQCQIDLPPASVSGYLIPPLTLQTLLENAVKHNRIDLEHPMKVRIWEEKGQLIMENPIHPRKDQPPSHGVGLENLRQRYLILSNQTIEIQEQEDRFRVILPPLKAQHL